MSQDKPVQTSADDALRQQTLEQVRQSTSFAYDSLVVQQNKHKIPEQVFVAHFLPYFSGQDLGQGRNVVAEWIGVAGSPMAEVDVVDQKGEVVYSVPPIYNTNILEIANRKAGQSVADIFQQYELRRAGVPAAANAYLNQNLADKSREMVIGQIDENSVAGRWNSIMSRYGIKPTAEAEKAGGTSKPAQPADDDVLYD